MKKISSVLFAVYLFILSVLPAAVIYNADKLHTKINRTEISAVCRSIEQTFPQGDDNLRIATYNLLADGIGFYGGRDELRANGTIELFGAVNADVIGLQEVSRWWFCNINNDTQYAFVDSLQTELRGFMTAIIYNPQRVTLLDYGNIPLERGSNHHLRRIVWAFFKNSGNDKCFCVVNTHLNLCDDDNSASIYQAMQLTDLVRVLKDKYNCSVIVTGDFNAKNRGAVSYCSSVVYDLLRLKMADTHYYTHSKSYGKVSDHNRCLDHIFTVGDIWVEKWVILSQKPLNSLSDHYMLFSDIKI